MAKEFVVVYGHRGRLLSKHFRKELPKVSTTPPLATLFCLFPSWLMVEMKAVLKAKRL